MTKNQIQEKLLQNGVKNLIQFGFTDADTESILTNKVHKEFFKSMLKDNLGHGATIDEAINELLTKIN